MACKNAVDRDYYVTVLDGSRVGFLLGPYKSHRTAKAKVERGRKLSLGANAWAWFYAFGTSSLPGGTECKTVFGK